MIQLGSLWAEKMTFRNEGTEGKSDCAKKAEKKRPKVTIYSNFRQNFRGFRAEKGANSPRRRGCGEDCSEAEG